MKEKPKKYYGVYPWHGDRRDLTPTNKDTNPEEYSQARFIQEIEPWSTVRR